jgi:hypothetical protein
MIELFKPYSVTAQGLCQILGVEGVSEVSGEHLLTLQGMLTALREGETTVEQLFKAANSSDERAADRGKQTIENVKNAYRKPETGQAASAIPLQPSTTENPPQPLQTVNMDAEPTEAETAAAKGTQTEPQKASSRPHRNPTSQRSGAGQPATSGSGKGDEKW